MRVQLLRILGVGFGIAIIVGDTIGTGIFRTPGEVAGHLGNATAIIAAWIAGGVFALFGTLAVTELATMLPQAGGWYVYSRRAFGNYGGFLVGCSDLTMQSVSIAYLSVAFSEFASELYPAFGAHVKLLAVACPSLLMLTNLLSLRVGSRTQQFTSLAKALGLVGFCLACFAMYPDKPLAAPAAAGTFMSLPKGGLLFAVVLSLQAVVVTYDGWYAAIYFVEEDRDPARNLPRSSIGGVLVCAAIFLLVNVALLHVLSLHQLAKSQFPAAAAAQAVFGSRGKYVILVLSMVAAVSTINAGLLISPRILFGMARDGLMPRWIASVNRGGTPTVPLFLCTGAAVALVLSGSFQTLIGVGSFLFVAVYLSGFSSLFVLRWREPTIHRPVRMWGYPWSSVGVCVASAAFLTLSAIADAKSALFTLLLAGISYPAYYLVAKRK